VSRVDPARYASGMNNVASTTSSDSARHARLERARRRVRRARTFFIIAVMAAFVSVGGHCLTEDDGSPTAAAGGADVTTGQ